MTNLQAQREKIALLAQQAKHLLSEKGAQTWSAQDQTQFDNYANEIELVKGQIRATEALRELEADKFFENAAPQRANREEGEGLDAVGATALYLRHGHNVTAEQALAIRNAMSTTTPAEGGYTVPSEIAALVIDQMKAYGGMRQVAQIITTAGGNALNFPASDGTAEVGEIVAENIGASALDISFGTVAVNPYKYSSKKIALPVELIQDSVIDVVGFVTNRLATRLARITNSHYTVGTGISQPAGVITRAGTGKTGLTGQTLGVTYDDLVDLIHSINVAYRTPASRFMLNDLSLAVLRKLKDTTGRPIWNPGDNEGIADGIPGTICGYAYTVNNDMAVMAANARSIAFGDFSQYIIRDVANSTSLRRFDDSAFALNGQVGFCGWQRTGGNLVDTSAVKVYVNSAT